MKGAPMGSPLPPALANTCVEDFELSAIRTSAYKPSCWISYVSDFLCHIVTWFGNPLCLPRPPQFHLP